MGPVVSVVYVPPPLDLGGGGGCFTGAGILGDAVLGNIGGLGNQHTSQVPPRKGCIVNIN